jgi:uncharacterized membrane protein YoaT (DUF817 family)
VTGELRDIWQGVQTARRTTPGSFAQDFLFFAVKQLRACVFAGSFFILLFLSRHLSLGDLPRYDFLFICAVAIQVLLVILKIESPKEALAISAFHLVGLGLELFKTSPSVGSWSYPEFGYLKVGSVPLYAGFMYAAVGSYIMQSWTVLRLRFEPFPRRLYGVVICILIYGNFFTNHWLHDVRWLLMVLVGAIYWKTMVAFTPHTKEYRMPLLLAFILIAFFIWIAENMATYLGAWSYPNQASSWNLVSLSKISSWSLLVLISFIIVATAKQRIARRPEA